MKKTYIYGAMAVGLLFTACKSDDLTLENESPSVAQADKTLYVNMNIRGDVGSRAAADDGNPVTGTDFADGVGESDVRNAYFVFYDNDGNTVGEVINVSLTGATPVTDGAGSVEKTYQATIPVSVYKGEQDPTQVVCYINPISPASLQNPLGTIETVTRQECYYTADSKKYFPMSNSVYYPSETAEAPRVAVEVKKEQLHANEEAAKLALQNNQTSKIIDIYVERYASKMTFDAASVEIEAYPTASSKINDDTEVPVSLEFVPLYWQVNAQCTESYVVKSFREESQEGVLLPNLYSYADMNRRIQANALSGTPANPVYNDIQTGANEWKWNNATLHRSFWSCSPAYFTQTYPQVSSDVKPTGGMNGTQKYWSLDELKPRTLPNGGGKGFNAATASSQYFHETTVGARALLSVNPAAAVPSVIYVGKYTISIGEDASKRELPENTTFYTYLRGSNGNPQVYFEGSGNLGTSTVAEGESMLRRFIEQASGLFKYDEEASDYIRFDITNEDDMKKLVSVFEVAFPSDEVKGDLVLSSRYRTLQIKEGAREAGLTDGIFIAAGNGYQAIAADDENVGEGKLSLVDANKAIMQQVGYCVRYEASHGYFNLPVKHYGWYRPIKNQTEGSDIDWNKVRVGDFGMVRNHSYSMQVSKVVGLATGIGGSADPIVPPSDTNDYYVAYRVNVLQWAVVPADEGIIL